MFQAYGEILLMHVDLPVQGQLPGLSVFIQNKIMTEVYPDTLNWLYMAIVMKNNKIMMHMFMSGSGSIIAF